MFQHHRLCQESRGIFEVMRIINKEIQSRRFSVDTPQSFLISQKVIQVRSWRVSNLISLVDKGVWKKKGRKC